MGFDSLPALFWPILCVLLLLITGYHGWISPIVKKRRVSGGKICRRM